MVKIVTVFRKRTDLCAIFYVIQLVINLKCIILFFLVVGLLGINTKTHAQYTDISQIRNLIFDTDFDLDKSKELFKGIKDSGLQEPIAKAYEGAAEALVAKYVWNPFSKLYHLRNAMSTIDEAVFSDKENIEIRFLRFYVSSVLPSYFGYDRNMDEDKSVIIKNIMNPSAFSLSRDLMYFISSFMRDSGKCSEEEIKLIDQLLAGRLK